MYKRQGLSLGEYSALYAAGVFDQTTALDLVRYRGQVMEEAVQGIDSKMVAVLGLDRALDVSYTQLRLRMIP